MEQIKFELPFIKAVRIELSTTLVVENLELVGDLLFESKISHFDECQARYHQLMLFKANAYKAHPT